MNYFETISERNKYYLSLSCGESFSTIGFVSSIKEIHDNAIAYGVAMGVTQVKVMLGCNIMDGDVDTKVYEIQYSIKEIEK